MRKSIISLIVAVAFLMTCFSASALAADPQAGYAEIPTSSFYPIGDCGTYVDTSSANGLAYTVKAVAPADSQLYSASGNFMANLFVNKFLVIKMADPMIKFSVFFRTDGTDVQQVGVFTGWVPTLDNGNLVIDLSQFPGLNITNVKQECRILFVLGLGVWGNAAIGDKIEIQDMYLTDSAANLKPLASTIGAEKLENADISNISVYDTLTFNEDGSFSLTNKPDVNAGDFAVNFGGIDLAKTPYLYVDVRQAAAGMVVDFMGETTSLSDPEAIRQLNASSVMPGLLKFDLRSIYPNGIAADSKKYVRVYTLGVSNTNIYNGVYLGGPIFQIGPTITIADFDSTTVAPDPITVNASTDFGTLNAASHVFTENGSFDFVATDSETGIITTKTVTITNIGTPETTPEVTSEPSPTTGDASANVLYGFLLLAGLAIAGAAVGKKARN